MLSIQLVKQLNNTELGKGGTHDTYVLIPNELDVTDIFDMPNVQMIFTDSDTGEKVTVRETVAREKRIVGLGQYYKSKDLSAGDEIVFEKRIYAGKEQLLIRTVRHPNIIVFQKEKNGFEFLTPERMPRINAYKSSHDSELDVNFICSAKKRNDSPEKTDFYDIMINGKSICDMYSSKEIGILYLDGEIKIQKFYGWKKYKSDMEDN